MISHQHSSLSAGRWFTLTLAEQMGNIGSEIGRAVARRKKQEHEQCDRALARALELFDFTLADTRWRTGIKEIARAREVVCDVFFGDNVYHTDLSSLEKYFFFFAYEARRQR